jgi:hypothetical protein
MIGGEMHTGTYHCENMCTIIRVYTCEESAMSYI